MKDQHYALHLRAALAAGLWRTQHPARVYYSGAPLSWPELFRKFTKHCHPAHPVAHIAQHTHTLASLLATDVDDEDVVGNTADLPLDIDSECVLRGQEQDAITAYAALQGLLRDNEPTNSLYFVLAYYAYALGKPEECLKHLASVSDILLIQNHIPTPSQDPMRSHAPSLLGHSSSRAEPSLISIPSLSSSSPPLPEIRDGRAWAMTEAFRSICLQGMSCERLHPSDPHRALRAYISATPLFTILTSEFTLSSTSTTTVATTITTTAAATTTITHQPTGKLDFSPFFQLRELWRWVERLLWRAVVLSSRICDVHQEDHDATTTDSFSLWPWFTHYTTCSAAWPSSFRTAHRSTISTLFLRAFVLRYRVLSRSPLSMPYASGPKGKWVSQARSLVQDYRAILGSSTHFPRAGERNRRVEELVDLCVAVWEVASGGVGEFAGWVIDILWWATRYTFNSPRIYRHMTRLFHLAGDTPLAKRTLKLYVQIVGKAWLVAQKNMQQQQNEKTILDPLENGDEESDEQWIEMMVFGVRMLCRFVATAAAAAVGHDDGLEGMDDLRYAGTLIEKARERLVLLDSEKKKEMLEANVWIAEGVWNSIMALREEDPYTRPQRLNHAHDCFTRSIEVIPTPIGYYHLALSLARVSATTTAVAGSGSGLTLSRDIKKAVENAGMALEGEPKEIRYWHLLGLLLTVEERWKEAEEVLERGAELDRELRGEEEEEEEEEEEATVVGNGNGLPTTTSEDPTPEEPEPEPEPAPAPVYVLEGDRTTTTPIIPPTSELLRSMLESSPPSRRDLYEYSLQLRMTQVALTEVVKGGEGAEVKWVEVFAWIAERKKGWGGVGGMHSSENSHRLSMESSVPLSTIGHKIFGLGGGGSGGGTTATSIQGGEGMTGDNRMAEVISLDSNREEELHDRQQQQQQQQSLPVPVPVPLSPVSGSPHIVSPIPITISPATPEPGTLHHEQEVVYSPEDGVFLEKERDNKDKDKEREKEKDKTKMNGLRVKRSISIDRGGGGGGGGGGGDTSKSKKVQQMLKDHVHKGRAGISAVSRKIGHGVSKHHNLHLRRTNSSPNFHEVIRNASFQASSIHSRRRLGSFMQFNDRTSTASPPPPLQLPPPPPPPPPPSSSSGWAPNPQSSGAMQPELKLTSRQARENRLLSDLWLMSAATFRRLGKIEQVKAAIQEAEVRDEGNPAVWVQLGLYFVALGQRQDAIDALQKALFICPDDVAATIHLSRLYLMPVSSKSTASMTSPTTATTNATTSNSSSATAGDTSPTSTFNSTWAPAPGGGGHKGDEPDRSNVDLAAGLLAHLTRGKGWDVPEAWYFLAKAYGMQGRKEREREALKMALEVSEGRGVREVQSALGWCI